MFKKQSKIVENYFPQETKAEKLLQDHMLVLIEFLQERHIPYTQLEDSIVINL